MKPPAMFCRDTPLQLRDSDIMLLLFRRAQAPPRRTWWQRVLDWCRLR